MFRLPAIHETAFSRNVGIKFLGIITTANFGYLSLDVVTTDPHHQEPIRWSLHVHLFLESTFSRADL